MRAAWASLLLLAALFVGADAPCPQIVDGMVAIEASQNGRACTSDCTVGEVMLTATIFGSFACGPHSFTWAFDDGTNAITYTPEVVHYYAQPGAHEATLQVLGGDTEQLSGNPYVSASAVIGIVNGSVPSLSGAAVVGLATALAFAGARIVGLKP
jgi:hypothetical protein